MLLQVVLDTMKRHANHTKVVLRACWVLYIMMTANFDTAPHMSSSGPVMNAANRAAIIAQGGVAASRDVKRNHPGNGEIQNIADGLLAALMHANVQWM